LPIFTIGHSTRSIDELTSLLTRNEVELVVDVRRFPGSRRLPQFESRALASALAEQGIAYHWIEALGGRRRATGTSATSAWRNAAFSAYADYLTTESFADGLFELLMLATGLRTAIMCAEAVWWRCHRRLIADVLTSLGFDVEHIMGAGATRTHEIAPPARLVSGTLSYDAD
jgi:uncharacterized protein (DUF488 family)